MVMTFDPKKDAINQAKHGVSLRAAEHLEWDKELAIQAIDVTMAKRAGSVSLRWRAEFIAWCIRSVMGMNCALLACAGLTNAR